MGFASFCPAEVTLRKMVTSIRGIVVLKAWHLARNTVKARYDLPGHCRATARPYSEFND
jgi:hypothetical protein